VKEVGVRVRVGEEREEEGREGVGWHSRWAARKGTITCRVGQCPSTSRRHMLASIELVNTGLLPCALAMPQQQSLLHKTLQGTHRSGGSYSRWGWCTAQWMGCTGTGHSLC
jgi:hypothetical protein